MLIIALLLAGGASAAPACKPASGDATAVLRRAADVTGLSRAGGRILRVNGTDITTHDYESDRAYAPFLLQSASFTEWFDAPTGADRITTSQSMIGGYQYAGGTTLGGRLASYGVRDTTMIPSPDLHGQLATTRPLNVWAVLADWIASNDARVVETCELRDYSRLVLARPAANGRSAERLLVDPKTTYPVALERVEPHYLWGQTRVQYLYATWTRIGAAHLPGTATRMVDGSPEITRSFGRLDFISRDSAPPLGLPSLAAPMTPVVAAFLAATAPDTVRVSATTFILRNRGYSETVTLARDTVFVFDATQGDERARQDSAWIGRLFPGKHPIAVVVTDLAWPHVAGVRYWVAQGATIISHRASRSFLERVVARHWTDAPDVLERRRGRGVSLTFRPVSDSLRVAGGAITLFAIDGAASEGALAAYVHGDQFLWASDYVQTLSQPTQYLEEVATAVRRMGLTPVKVAAEHLPLSDWSRAVRLVDAPASP